MTLRTIASRASLALLGLVVLLWAAPVQAQAYRGKIAQGWTFMEAGNFRKAEEAFKAAFATQEGKNAAETYYAIAALWWERRNAMAAYMWLSDAEKASRNSFSWDGGPDGEWDSRIAQRRAFIERNFGAVRLKAPSRGNPLPPLADPTPSDPLLKEFTDNLPTVIDEGVKEKVAVQWVLLPAGDYWVGDTVIPLESGQLDASKAPAWDLPKDGGKTRRAYDERVAAIARGESPAALALAQQKQAEREAAEAAEAERLAAEKAERDRLAAEKAEADRLAREERERIAAEKTEAERVAAAEKAEAERLAAAEKAEAERAAREERERLAAEKAEAERKAREQQERLAAEKADSERKAREEQEREAERLAAADRKAQEKADKEAAAEADRRAKEAADAQARADKLEAERRSREEAEAKARAERLAADQKAAEEQRRQDEWDEAQARMKADQEREREAERLRRQQLQEQRATASSAADAVFETRRLAMSVGGGGSSVTRLTATGTGAEADWTANAQIDYIVPIKGATVALPVGVSWSNLPVNGCSHQQTRANAVSLNVGPRLSTPIKGRLWLSGRIGGHVGGAASFPTGNVRNSCATASLDEGADGVAYGTRLTGEDGNTARLSLADLGWTGWALVMGPQADVGILGAPGAGPSYLGVNFFVRYDQVVPIIRGAAYYFQPEGGSSLQPSKKTLSTVAGGASMPRFQFGLQGRILF